MSRWNDLIPVANQAERDARKAARAKLRADQTHVEAIATTEMAQMVEAARNANNVPSLRVVVADMAQQIQTLAEQIEALSRLSGGAPR